MVALQKLIPLIIAASLIGIPNTLAVDKYDYYHTVGASANQEGNIPINAFDGDLESRWACEGDGCWLGIKLDERTTLSRLGVAYIKGDQRIYSFDIEVSDDALSWKRIYSGKTSGTTNDVEYYTFTPTATSFVRIVGHGSNENAWNNISEIVGITPAKNEIGVSVRGSMLLTDTTPIMQNDRVLVPFRAILTALGAEVDYDAEEQRVSATLEGNKVELTIGSQIGYVNGEEVTLDVPAITQDDRTLVPLRFLSEGLGANVSWDDDSSTAIVKVKEVSDDIMDALNEMDALFNGAGILDWKVKLYDPTTRGFYYALSSVNNQGFGPDIESSAQIGFPYDRTSDEFKRGFGEWIQSMQSNDDGWFYEPQYGKDVQESKKTRNYTQAITLLNKVGMTPLYRTPDERVADGTNTGTVKQSKNDDNFLASKEATLAWLEDNFDWSTSAGMWSAGNTLDGYFGVFKKLGYIDDVLDFITSKQNHETGMWGDEISYNAVSGAAKFSFAGYSATTKPYPNYDKLVHNVFKIFESGEPTGGLSHIWNVIVALQKGKQSYGAKLDPAVEAELKEKLPRIIHETTTDMARHKRADGGFSYTTNDKDGQSISQGAITSLGMDESDVNGTQLAIGTRTLVYDLCGVEMPPLYSDTDFLNRCLAKEPITEPYVSDPRVEVATFDDCELGSIPEFLTTDAGDGTIGVVTNPWNKENRVLSIGASKGTNQLVSTSFVVDKSKPGVVGSFKFMMCDNGTDSSYQIQFGSALNMVIRLKKGKVSIYNRATGMELGSIICSLRANEWYDMRVEYTVKDGVPSTLLYIDGDQAGKSNVYYGSPAKASGSFNAITIISFKDASAELLLDKITVK